MGTTGAKAVGRKQYEVEVPKAKILLVDDNRDVLNSMSAVLEVLDEEVLTASSANEALRHLLKHDPAVIVLDVMMPETDGFQLAAMIRQRERFKHTPILFLTGLGKEDRHMLQGYQAGAVDYLLKPVDPDVLRSKVRIFVELAKKNDMLQRYTEMLRANSERLEEALEDTIKAKQNLEAEMAERRRVQTSRDRLAGQLGAMPDFVSHMAEGAVTAGLDGAILYCNNRFGEMLNQDASELAGTSIHDIISPQYREVFSAALPGARSGRITAELEFVSATGELVPAQVALSSFNGAEIEAIAMVVTDLRDQKRNERLLTEGRLARMMLEQAHSGMAVCDESGRITLASRIFHEICKENPLFRDFDDVLPLQVVHQHTSGERRFSIRDVLAGVNHKSTEVLLRRHDGTELPLLMTAGRIQSDNGAIVGGVIALFDISDRKTIEEALRRSEKLAAAGRIAGALAHEINNPLSAVTNILYLLENSSLEEKLQYYVSLASSELARVSHIVRNTLSFYRESSKPVAVSVTEVIDYVLEVYNRHITEKSVNIVKRYEFDEVIDSFPGELRQIFSNLISNSIDALPAAGDLILSVRTAVHPQTKIEGVRVTIADRGHGISREHREKLFEPFFTTKGEKGTGLGLWVTQGILQKQGGSIRVRSCCDPQNSWTAFSVFIPGAVHAMEANMALSRAQEIA
jgi:PAS domain S-box-containing protein